MAEKIKIHEWDIAPYPRKLWIVKTKDPRCIAKYFTDDRGEEIDFDRSRIDTAKAAVIDVAHRKNGCLGYVVTICERLNVEDVAHEAWHVVDDLCEQTGVMQAAGTGNEHIAYLIGWVADKIWQVVTNKIK